jgi:beta-glucuronidase
VDHGVVDEYRQRRPSYYVWKEMNAPATIRAEWNSGAEVPTSFKVTVKPNSAETLPFYPLRDYRLRWEVYDENKLLTQGERSFEVLNSAQTVSGEVGKGLGGRTLQLHLALIRPTGETAAEKILDWNTSQQARQVEKIAVPAP